jgi:hypothetical protein
MTDAIWEQAFHDQEQTRQRILGLEEEMAHEREHLNEIEVFQKLLTVYNAASPDALEQVARTAPQVIEAVDTEAPRVDAPSHEALLAIKNSIFGWDARSA